MATIPPTGAVPDVVTNTLIPIDWGNAIGSASKGRAVQRFNSIAERDASITAPVAGMLCYVLATDLFYGYRSSSGWTALIGGPRDTAHAFMARGGGFTVPSADTPVPFDTTVNDPMGLWVPAQTAFVIQTAGMYLFSASLVIALTGPNSCYLHLWRNGGSVRSQSLTMNISGSLPLSLTIPVKCAAGDKLQVAAYANPAAGLSGAAEYNGGSVDYLGTG